MSNVVRWGKFFACCCAVVLVTGCAFGTRQPTLTYPPIEESKEQPAATPTPKSTKVFLEPFRDERSDKTVVGTVRNGLGMRTADVVPTNSVPVWVTEAIRTELINSGYTVTNGAPPSTSSPGNILISGDVLDVFCDMYMSYSGRVSFVAKVKDNRGELLNKHYNGEGSAGMAIGGASDSYAQSLSLALSDAIKKFIADLEEKLSRR